MKMYDPIHREVVLDDPDWLELVQTPAFRRLKGLKQQGNTAFLLPQAVHTRHEHTLGVYETVRRMLLHLSEQMEFTPLERRIALASALLHDIGHGPFSHCFEPITGIHHEVWSARLIAEDPPIAGILARTPGLQEGVRSLIRKEGRYPLLEQLLFSPLGADAMDYHLRDLHHSGLPAVPFRQPVILSALTVANGRLALREEALPEVEQWVRNKRLLFEEGFGHPRVIGKDVLLKRTIRRAGKLYAAGRLNPAAMPAALTPLFEGPSWPIGGYLTLDDAYVVSAVEAWSEATDPGLAGLSAGFLSSEEDGFIWRPVDAETLPMGVEQEEGGFSELVTPNLNYARYRSGVFMLVEGVPVDVRERSAWIREFTTDKPRHYLFTFPVSDL